MYIYNALHDAMYVSRFKADKTCSWKKKLFLGIPMDAMNP